MQIHLLMLCVYTETGSVQFSYFCTFFLYLQLSTEMNVYVKKYIVFKHCWTCVAFNLMWKPSEEINLICCGLDVYATVECIC